MNLLPPEFWLFEAEEQRLELLGRLAKKRLDTSCTQKC